MNSPASTPSSTAAQNVRNEDGSLTKASKDKACPFCNQPFTSSSLGRHLDLYIKPKNPKPADGIHDVEKIKLIRGGITRRQPRSSLKGKNERDDTSETQTPTVASVEPRWDGRASAMSAPKDSPSWNRRNMTDGYDRRGNDRMKVTFNAANWQATGVINDIPSNADSEQISTPASHGNQHGDEPSISTQSAGVDGDEVGKAAQLALREVLDSLEAAK